MTKKSILTGLSIGLYVMMFMSFNLVVSAQDSIHYSFAKKPYWADEFTRAGLPDTNKWVYQAGGDGGGNNELEYYTDEKNAIVKKGILTIEARKENYRGKNYTSARLVTKGKAEFQYGRFEIRAKLSDGKGLWPAIWMMPVKESYGDWPASGEIDIMEQVGYQPDSIHISTHTRERNWMNGNQGTAVVQVKTATSAFHLYRLDWTPEGLKGFIDSKQVFNYPNTHQGEGYYPFNQPFYLILNVAVGGFWGGKYGVDDYIFPATMQVDYVRVYKLIKK
jgi:beta-glucanase (GH16 family)